MPNTRSNAAVAGKQKKTSNGPTQQRQNVFDHEVNKTRQAEGKPRRLVPNILFLQSFPVAPRHSLPTGPLATQLNNIIHNCIEIFHNTPTPLATKITKPLIAPQTIQPTAILFINTHDIVGDNIKAFEIAWDRYVNNDCCKYEVT